MNELSAREQSILNFMREEVKKNGYPPTVRDICAALGIKSTSTVQAAMEALEKNGYIRKLPGKRRAVEVFEDDKITAIRKASDSFPEAAPDVVEIPVVGRIAAGSPILADQNIEDSIPLPSRFVSKGNNFMLTVHGDSMIEAGIFDGDYILVKEQKTANNGEIVVAMINNFESEATVKTFYKENGHIRLQPENPTMDPIIVEDCQILGLVKGVFRYLQ